MQDIGYVCDSMKASVNPKGVVTHRSALESVEVFHKRPALG